MNTLKEKIETVWTVIPNDFEFSTQHFKTESEAIAWAKTYEDGASVTKNELPERVVRLKEKRTARYGYKL